MSSSIDIVEKMFNAHKVKFATMETLFADVEVREVISRVNVFINIESILTALHIDMIDNMIMSMDKRETSIFHNAIVAGAVNLAAHYRRFFTKNRIRSNIVLFADAMDNSCQKNNYLHVRHYRDRFVYDYTENERFLAINEVLKSSLNVVQKICDYIEDVHLVRSSRIEPSLIPLTLIKSKTLDGQLNIIVTRDVYDLQYTEKNFIVLYALRGDTKLVTKSNLFEVLREKHNFANSRTLPGYLLPFFIAVNGNKKRGIEKIRGMGWKSTYSALCKLYDDLFITNEEIVSFEHLACCIKENPDDPTDKRKKVVDNYLAIDLDRQMSMVSEAQSIEVYSQLVNRFEDGALQKLNATTMAMTPINIMELNQYSFRRRPVF